VPVGRYANPDWVRAAQVRAASEVLSSVRVERGDFEYVLDAATAGDLVYFDPPYEPVSRTADFTDYTAEEFDREDQRRPLGVARELGERGVHVVRSNSGVTHDRYAEAGFRVARQRATRAINSDVDGRGEVEEIGRHDRPAGATRGRRLSGAAAGSRQLPRLIGDGAVQWCEWRKR
jgi:DNA adenine methylase